MAQSSIACYFNSRKRPAAEDTKINRAKKVLVLDEHCGVKNTVDNPKDVIYQKISREERCNSPNNLVKPKSAKKIVANRIRTTKTVSDKGDIRRFFTNMPKETDSPLLPCDMALKHHTTPPSSPTKNANAMDKINPEGPSLKEIKRKLTRSARLADLKASMSRFQEKAEKLEEIEKKTSTIPESPRLKTFRTIELEVQTSPQKLFSPEKQYLSPKKDLGARRNLFNLQSPTKNAVPLPADSPAKQILHETSRPALGLPYKYKYIAELFRSTDIVCQIMFNRKETITFAKLKSAVEEMLKRNLLEKHLAQIRSIFPEAYEFARQKMKVFGAGMRQERWELVVSPTFGDVEHVSSDTLLQRRRKLYSILLDKAKHYHQEFLSSLDPPIVLNQRQLTRWHPEFDIEKVPDIECAPLPPAPVEQKLTTGKEVLEKVKLMFNCNTRMEQALEKLQEMKSSEASRSASETKEDDACNSHLKGIPKALLEKVRQKQAAKALLTMTRSADQEKELKIYSRLPEIARLTRSLFVSEKKSVLQLEVVVEKLGNCYRSHLSRVEMEEHLRVISKEFPSWLVFHMVRNCVYLKIAKGDDLSLIMQKLECLAKEKSELS
ncbi:unnamed protein product [Phyllotreta striolata]|uniref:CDT1 Geminin-binding domain-containing protein n=1 Tax=Phyllotreta striolata TaxID=444603 RepID=A0A9N9TM91_PHYSR|nr:unnamed protein product [Phyllotreta striolata]